MAVVGLLREAATPRVGARVDSRALQAVPSSVVDPCVLGGEGVPPFAVGDPQAGTTGMFTLGHGVQMVGVDAELDLAGVVELMPFGNRANQQGVRVTMGRHDLRRTGFVVTSPTDGESSVPLSVPAFASEQPASLRFVHLGPEPFLRGARGLQLQGSTFVHSVVMRLAQPAPLRLLGASVCSTSSICRHLGYKVFVAQGRPRARRQGSATLNAARHVHRLPTSLPRVVRLAETAVFDFVVASGLRASHGWDSSTRRMSGVS